MARWCLRSSIQLEVNGALASRFPFDFLSLFFWFLAFDCPLFSELIKQLFFGDQRNKKCSDGRIARGRSWRVLRATRRSLEAGSPTWRWWDGQPAYSAATNRNHGSPHGRSDPASPRSHADDHGARRHCRGLAPTDVSSANVAGPSASHREIAGGLIEQVSSIEEVDRALAPTASHHNRLTLITMILQVWSTR